MRLAPDAIDKAPFVSVRDRTETVVPELMSIVTAADGLIVTLSTAVGTVLVDQLAAVPQLALPALPVQEMLAGTVRSSSSSSLKREKPDRRRRGRLIRIG